MRPGRGLTAVATIGLVLSVLLLAWTAWSWWSPPEAAPEAAASTATAPAPVTPSPDAVPATASDPPTVEPTQPPEPTEVLRFEIPSANYTSDVRVMEIADSGVINPPDFVHTWWIRDRGVLPGSAAEDTTYLACHTDSKKAVSAVPCNGVGLDNVPVGSTINVTTDAEDLSYTVTQARKVPRDDFAHDTEVWDVNPGRLVWVSCYIGGGRRTDFNLVVIAELTS